jgi:hypothetical protein
VTIEDLGQARTAAAIAGVDFDSQDAYCEACRAYHVAATHQDEVPVECGEVSLQGFDVALDCNRPPHDGGDHRTVYGVTWANPHLPQEEQT